MGGIVSLALTQLVGSDTVGWIATLFLYPCESVRWAPQFPGFSGQAY